MKCTMLVLTLMFGAATGVTADEKHGRGKPDKAAKHAKVADDRRPVSTIHFSTGDAGVLHDYYYPRYKSLPPGLQKKVARGGRLPPGWQKKMRPFPIELERRLGPLPGGYGRGVIDRHAVIYDRRSHVVVDVTVLF